MEIDRDALDQSLDRLSRLTPDTVELADLLEEIVRSVNLVFDITGAGILMADGSRVLRSITSGDQAGKVLERVQEQLGEGPCIDSYFNDQQVSSGDVRTDPRWPRFTAAVVPHGIHAVLGMPVRIGGGPVGTLNVCSDTPRAWTPTELDAITSYARVLENMLLAGSIAHRNDRLARDLQYALDYRIPIERAVGYLMAVHKIEPAGAFELLRRAARDSRRRVADLAGEVLAGELRL